MYVGIHKQLTEAGIEFDAPHDPKSLTSMPASRWSRRITSDGVRKRRAIANRIFTVLKAALNHAWKAGHIATDDAWRRVQPFKASAWHVRQRMNLPFCRPSSTSRVRTSCWSCSRYAPTACGEA